MRPVTRQVLSLGLAVTGATLPALPRIAGAQAVRVTQRESVRNDSLADRVLAADAETVQRMVARWREREAALMRELRAMPEGDADGRRRLGQQLADHARDGFVMMSAIQARCIEEGGPRPPGYLGLNLTNTFTVENQRPRALGTRVASVEPGSPAERAGIQRGDQVLALGGLDATERTPDIAAQLQPGRSVAVRVERDGAVREYAITVARRPQGFGDSCGEFERALVPLRLSGTGRIVVEERGTGQRRVLVEGRDPAMTVEPESEVRFFIFGPGAQNKAAVGFFAGAEFRMLDADWGEVLGVRQGVIVSEVADGSAAALSGLKSGDVITAVGRSPVAEPMLLVQILGADEDREAALSVVRKREKKSVTLRWGPR